MEYLRPYVDVASHFSRNVLMQSVTGKYKNVLIKKRLFKKLKYGNKFERINRNHSRELPHIYTVCKRVREKSSSTKMCSAINLLEPKSNIVWEFERKLDLEKSNDRSDDIICLDTTNTKLNAVEGSSLKKRKLGNDSGVEIIFEMNLKKRKLQLCDQQKCKIRKTDPNQRILSNTNSLEKCNSTLSQNKCILDTINIDEPVSVCESDDEVIVVDETPNAPKIDKSNRPKGSIASSVSSIIPHYDRTLLEFIPLHNSTPKPVEVFSVSDKNSTPKVRGALSKRNRHGIKPLKKRRKHLTISGTGECETITINTPSASEINPKPPTAQPALPVPSSPASEFGNNFYNPNHKSTEKSGLRPVIIDGSNVAMGAFVPRFRKGACTPDLQQQMDFFETSGNVVFTPSRRIEGRLVVSYDDRYIVQCAAELGGIIVSTDNYNDLLQENQSWKETIERRLLMFTWIGDMLMFPQDPLGRFGPSLEEFLRFPNNP